MWEYKTDDVKKTLFVLVMAWLWFVGLSFDTALGAVYNVYEKTKYLAIITFFIEYFFFDAFKKFPKTVILILMFFLASWIYHTYVFWYDYTDYIWVYLIPIVLSKMTVSEKQMNWISLIYGAFGFGVLFLANYTHTFSGWDENSLTMPCFFGYTVFAVSYSELRNKKLWFFMIFSLFYMIMLWSMKSRGSIVFSVFLLLCVFSVIPYRKRLNEKKFLLYLLLPLIIAIISVSIINVAPIQKFLAYLASFTSKKTFFNGRDQLWASGFRTFRKNWLFGTGSLRIRYHNSAVSCLAGAGGVAYVIWILSLKKALASSLPYINDKYVYGLTLSFVAIWLQQSFELGLIAQQGNVIPFTVLGLLLARINTLRGEENEKLLGNNSRI